MSYILQRFIIKLTLLYTVSFFRCLGLILVLGFSVLVLVLHLLSCHCENLMNKGRKNKELLHLYKFVMHCSYTKIVIKGMTKAEMILKVSCSILYVALYSIVLCIIRSTFQFLLLTRSTH